jgi:ATP-dependent helicase Lhr and Lhr-like helicase
LSGCDPLNLVGVLTPGPRVPALRTHAVVYRDGAPVAAGSRAEIGLGLEGECKLGSAGAARRDFSLPPV